jgi:hypothetical protein
VNDRPPVGVFLPLPILWLICDTRLSKTHPRLNTSQPSTRPGLKCAVADGGRSRYCTLLLLCSLARPLVPAHSLLAAFEALESAGRLTSERCCGSSAGSGSGSAHTERTLSTSLMHTYRPTEASPPREKRTLPFPHSLTLPLSLFVFSRHSLVAHLCSESAPRIPRPVPAPGPVPPRTGHISLSLSLPLCLSSHLISTHRSPARIAKLKTVQKSPVGSQIQTGPN